MAKLRLNGVTKRYGDLIAVDNISLEVGDGEFSALLGPSGCGKTTTMRCIAGLEAPDEGDIYLDDDRINDMPPEERDIAIVFQFYAMYPGTNVFGNIAFPLWARKLPENEVKRLVKETAEKLGIVDLLNKKLSKLNVGEKQRVALARALVREPRVFLFDEPLTNMDARLRLVIRGELKRFVKETKITSIVVSHDQLEAMTMADRIAVMNEGKLLQYDTVDKIFNHPKNVFIADFIGSPGMNLIDCSLKDKNGKISLDTGEFEIDVSKYRKIIKEKASSSELILGIRPEHVSIVKKKVTNVVKSSVEVVEPIGERQILDLTVKGVNFRAFTTEILDLKAGDGVLCEFDLEKLHVFDKTSGLAII